MCVIYNSKIINLRVHTPVANGFSSSELRANPRLIVWQLIKIALIKRAELDRYSCLIESLCETHSKSARKS